MSATRKVLFPIEDWTLWEFYKKGYDCIWKVEEVDMSKDYDDFVHKLNENERFFIKRVLAFFAVADSIVNINIIEYMQQNVPELEAQFFYNVQVVVENVHMEMYNLLIVELVHDAQERDELFNAFERMPCVRKKVDWILKWLNDDKNLETRLVAFAIVEGVFFSGSFASIFYIKSKGLMPGLTFSNELISRDEALHTEFACVYYRNNVKKKLASSIILQMFIEAVEIEKEFFTSALPVALLGMNANTMSQYIEFVADVLLEKLQQPKYFNTQNPFEFMNNISLEGKTNFFEKRVGEYKRFGAGVEKFELLDDF